MHTHLASSRQNCPLASTNHALTSMLGRDEFMDMALELCPGALSPNSGDCGKYS